MEENWTQAQPDAAVEAGTVSVPPFTPEEAGVVAIPPVAALPSPAPAPQTRLVEPARTPAQALEAFEQVYRSSPAEFATISGVAGLTPEARRQLAQLLTLSSAARDALAEVLLLPDDTRDVVLRVLELPPDVRETLRVFLQT